MIFFACEGHRQKRQPLLIIVNHKFKIFTQQIKYIWQRFDRVFNTVYAYSLLFLCMLNLIFSHTKVFFCISYLILSVCFGSLFLFLCLSVFGFLIGQLFKKKMIRSKLTTKIIWANTRKLIVLTYITCWHYSIIIFRNLQITLFCKSNWTVDTNHHCPTPNAFAYG